MSLKSAIDATITAIDTGGLNSAAEVRTTLQAIADESYKTISIQDSHTTTNIFTASNASVFQYSLTTKKQGGVVYVEGFVRNVSSSFATGNVAVINDPEYYPASGVLVTKGITAWSITDNNSIVNLGISTTTNTLLILDNIAPSEFINFKGHYSINQ